MPYSKCRLCPRGCGVNRLLGELGRCKSGATPIVARAALHFWEEPPISGSRGSGAIFFSGCQLACKFCQNAKISRGECGEKKTPEQLSDIMLRLEERGAHNINLVTPSHFAPSIVRAIELARSRGLSVPIVYNTSAYDEVGTLRMFDGLVNIYLPDFKYYRAESAAKYSSAADYPKVAELAIAEMVRQCPSPKIADGIMSSGVIIRILELPCHVAEAKLSLGALYRRFGDRVYFSLMNQYTPMEGAPAPLDRPLSREEYGQLTDYALRLGIKNAFTQEFGTASESFIPDFDSCEMP